MPSRRTYKALNRPTNTTSANKPAKSPARKKKKSPKKPKGRKAY